MGKINTFTKSKIHPYTQANPLQHTYILVSNDSETFEVTFDSVTGFHTHRIWMDGGGGGGGDYAYGRACVRKKSYFNYFHVHLKFKAKL